jgi:hypothetical protein
MTETAEAMPVPEAPLPPVDTPAPISADSVVTKAPEAIPAPDSSILSDRLDQMLTRRESIDQRRGQEAEYQRLQEKVKILETMTGPAFQQKYDEATQEITQADDSQSQIMKQLQSKIDTMEQSQQTLQTRLQEKQEQTDLAEASREVAAWVETQAEEFPLINANKFQPLVFQKMWNTKQQTGTMMSETQATREIEQELGDIVRKCAPLMGYQQGEQTAGSELPNEETISLTNDGLSLSEPVDRDKMSNDEWDEYLIRQFQNG